jgi:hypothetical protein
MSPPDGSWGGFVPSEEVTEAALLLALHGLSFPKAGVRRKGKRPQSAFLEPLTGPVKHIPFVVYDIEAKHGDSDKAGFTRPFLVGFYDGTTHYAFRNDPHLARLPWGERATAPGGCIDKFLRHVLTPAFAKHNIYAHNGGNFDHLHLLHWLAQHRDEFTFEVIPVQSSIQLIRVFEIPKSERALSEEERKKKRAKHKRRYWTFLDSMKLLPMGLDKAAKSFGLTGKTEIDLDLPEDDFRWEAYNSVDNEQLYEVMKKAHSLIEDKLGGEVGITTPATSMKLFRRKYLGRDGTPLRIPRYVHFPDCTLEGCEGCNHTFVRRAYYGGRCEIFRTYGEGLHYYDFNSSYVAAMQETMPAGDRMVAEGFLDWRLTKTFIGFAECTVYIPPECPIPPLPFRVPKGGITTRDGRHVSEGKLIFPTGTFTGVWDTDELALVEDSLVGGKILSVGKVVWYTRKMLFGPMMRDLYQLRDKSRPDYDEGLSMLAKLLGNGLYGKFGMKTERETIVFARDVQPGECFLCGKPARGQICDACEGSTPASSEEDCEVWYQKKTVNAPYIIPQIAAHITSLARIRLWNWMKTAILMGGKIYYVDTDSIITDVVLPSSSALGDLKDEYPGETLRGSFVQPKVYLLEKERPFVGEHEEDCAFKHGKACKGCVTSKVAMKGFPKRDPTLGVSIRTKSNLMKLRDGENVVFHRLEKVRSLASAQFRRPPELVRIEKGFRLPYDKRTVLPDGNTSALVLDT